MTGGGRASAVFGAAGGACYALLYLLYLRGGTGLALGVLLLTITTAVPAALAYQMAPLMARDAARARNRVDRVLRGGVAGAVLSIGAAILGGMMLCGVLELGTVHNASGVVDGTANVLTSLVWGGLLGAFCSQYALPFGALAGAALYLNMAQTDRARPPEASRQSRAG